MKNILLFVIFVSVFSSCSKDDDSEIIKPELIGKWKWVETSGGFPYTLETPNSTGVQKAIEFSENTIYEYVNGVLERELPYRIEIGESIYNTEEVSLIVYDNMLGAGQSFVVNGESLTLFDECHNCYIHKYTKE